MSYSGEAPVLVVGGGIAGLALGRALLNRQIPFNIVERRKAPADGGLAIILPGNAIRALAALGLGDQIEAAGRTLRRRQYRSSQDRLLCDIDEDEFWGFAARPRIIRRSALLAMLAAGLPDSMIRRDADVRKVTLHPTHAALTLFDGGNLDGRLVVGADGIHSTIRTQLFGSSSGPGQALLAQASWRFMAPNPGVDCWSLWTGPAGMILLAPVDNDVVYGWATCTKAPHSSYTPTLLEYLARGFPERVRRTVSYVLTHPDDLYLSPLEEVRLAHWHCGRAALIGDAAHASAPVWAQGAALALEDAIVLARALCDNQEAEPALQDFQDQRWKRVAHVRSQTDSASSAVKLPSAIRNMLIRLGGRQRYRNVYGPLKAEI